MTDGGSTHPAARRLSSPPDDLHARWAAWYPAAPPVGFLLREAYPERWLRIHSLPRSQRYATTGAESREILRRHNTVATDVLGEGAACMLLLYDECGEDTAHRVSRLGQVAAADGGPLALLGPLPATLWDEHDGAFVVPMCLYGGTLVWRPGILDGVIRAVADDLLRGLVVDLAHGQVYAPYDGGADLVFRTSAARDAARRTFRDWLSPHPRGL